MQKRDKERCIFECFLDACRSLKRSIKKWEQPKAQFPDVLCHTSQGRTEGFELGEWLNQSQMHASIQRKKTEQAILLTLKEIKLPPSVRSTLLTLLPNSPKFGKGDSKELRQEFIDLITKTSDSWLYQPASPGPQDKLIRDLTGLPTIGKYLCEVDINRPGAPSGIQFDLHDGAYSPDDAFESLLSIVQKKAQHYRQGLNMPVNLLVHYSTGYFHNTPYRGLETRTFSDVAKRAAAELSRRFEDMHLPFISIYLLQAVEPKPKAFLIWPCFRCCR